MVASVNQPTCVAASTDGRQHCTRCPRPNIVIERFPYSNVYMGKQILPYTGTESENQKSGSINLLIWAHSACPYKNYGLKCFTEGCELHKSSRHTSSANVACLTPHK